MNLLWTTSLLHSGALIQGIQVAASKISSKTMARLIAIQVIYQYHIGKQEESLKSLTQKMILFFQDEELKDNLEIINGELPKIKISSGFLDELVRLSSENLELIDSIIVEHLAENWKIQEMQPLVLAVLRVAIAELKFIPQTPFKVVINEFSDITHDLIGDYEVGFVNHILDTLAKEKS